MEKFWKTIARIMLVALIFLGTIVTPALADDMGPLSPGVKIQGRQLGVTEFIDPYECSDKCASDPQCLAVNWFEPTSTCTELIAYLAAIADYDYVSALKPQGYSD
ncbi:MAG: hypothetical protein F6J93_19250 [Oscillatoria sp. SIO1A7]|nr:hypothetical protein [Oscillatoria sp. SIO1A7]